MNQSKTSLNGKKFQSKVELCLNSLRSGNGVIVTDDEARENEGDLIFPAETLTNEQMAMLIRECSGIVCLCLEEDMVARLNLPMMVENNQSRYKTAFTVSIEAAEGVTTGVSAADRVTTVKKAIADNARPEDINSPGHVFPLKGRKGGVLERAGHTEAAIDLMTMAGLKPCGVLCEITNPDGTMARVPELKVFSEKYGIPMVTVKDIVEYRKAAGMN